MRRPQDEAVQVAPRRLVEGTDRTAALLWRARKIPPPGNEKNFSALLARRDARVRRLRVGVAALAACLPLGLLLWSERPPAELLIAPERFGALVDAPATVDPPEAPARSAEDATDTEKSSRPEPRARAASEAEARDGTPSTPKDTRAPAPPVATDAPAPNDRAPARTPSPRELTNAPPPSQSSAERRTTSPTEERCSSWTSRGDYDAAASCFERKAAHSAGVSAEWALLEKARIHSRAQGKPGEALRTLDEYEARFPDGSLVREARLSRIEILTSAGRTTEALRTLDETLRRDQIPERTGELRLLRAQLRAETGHCEGALEDVRAALQQGVAPARARAIQEKCDPDGDSASR